VKRALVLLAACTPAKHPSWATPTTPIGPAHRGEHALHFGGGCQEQGVTAVSKTDAVLIVTCTVGQAITAYFVRRSAPDRGTSQQLGAWDQHRESGEAYSIDGATHDRVVVRHERGVSTELRIYDPARDAFTGQVITGAEVTVVVAPGGASATAFVCEPARGESWNREKTCSEQTGAQTRMIAID